MDEVEAELEGEEREMHVARAAAPYLVLVALVLVTRLVGPLNELLEQVELAWRTELASRHGAEVGDDWLPARRSHAGGRAHVLRSASQRLNIARRNE